MTCSPPPIFRVSALLLALLIGATLAGAAPLLSTDTPGSTLESGEGGAASPTTTPVDSADDDGSTPDGNANAGLRIQADFPARTVEAGETAVFVLNVNNRGGEEKARRLRASLPPGTSGWEYRFTDDEKREVTMVDIPSNDEMSVRLEVDTAAETKTGQYPIAVHIGEKRYQLYVTISTSHAGDKARIRLVVNDKEGDKVRGAEILLLTIGAGNQVDRILTDADGTVDAEVAPGTYDLVINREGYFEIRREEVRLKGGMATDLGTVTLEPKPFAAEVRLDASTVVGTAGRNTQFEMNLKNIGRADDTYRLGAEEVPQDWYVRYRDTENGNAEIEEVSLAPGDQRRLLIEAIPSRNTPPGTYNLTAIIHSGSETYARNLTIRMQGAADMKVVADRYQYDVSRGDALEFNFTVENAGNAGALTNLNTNISAPQGWSGLVTPQSVGSIPPGQTVEFRVRVVPPASISASEYRVNVRVVADQAEKTDEYRVVVHEQSYTALIGLLVLALVGAGVWFFFRRYRRR